MCDLSRYMTVYEALVRDFTPAKARRLRLLRKVIEVHKRHCSECQPSYTRTNFNAQPPKRLQYQRPREAKA